MTGVYLRDPVLQALLDHAEKDELKPTAERLKSRQAEWEAHNNRTREVPDER